MKTALYAALVMLLLLVAPAAALADGLIIVQPILPRPEPPGHAPLRSLAVRYHHVEVTIVGQLATTRIDQVFVNDTDRDLEGDYVFPLPPGASISAFAMWVDGRPLQARVLSADEARRIYEDIVATRRDPALLEYVGQNAYRARIYPIPAHGEKRVQIQYTEVLQQDAGLVRYVYPLNTEKYSSRPLEDVRITVTLETPRALQTVYSPSHGVAVERQGERRARITYHDEQVLPDKDFLLYYSSGEGDLAIDALSYREGEDGYFTLLISPGEPEDAAPIARDVTFVLDVSGSMRGEKLDQARAAARYVLEHLNPGDRLNVISFSSGVRAFAREPVGLERRAEAIHFLNQLVARGGTNIHQALQEALAQPAGERPRVIVSLTDGLATEGEIRTDRIIQAVRDRVDPSLRLFCFGVGYDVNTLLLDTIAQEARGASAYVQPEEDIERVVSSLYDRIARPVLADVALDFGDLEVYDVYPAVLPDLFAGEQLVVVGRYVEGGTADLVLSGVRDEAGTGDAPRERLAFSDVPFSTDGGEETIPRLWATRKIGHLLTQIRLNGADQELVDEIVELSVRYGIVTPYTSFLVDETEDALTAEGRREMAQREYRAAAPSAAPGGAGGSASALAPGDVAGEAAVNKSVAQEALRSAQTAADTGSSRVQTVGARTFVETDGAWVDTTFDETRMQPERVVLGSARYRALQKSHPDLGRYLALGERVIVVLGGKAYELVLE